MSLFALQHFTAAAAANDNDNDKGKTSANKVSERENNNKIVPHPSERPLNLTEIEISPAATSESLCPLSPTKLKT